MAQAQHWHYAPGAPGGNPGGVQMAAAPAPAPAPVGYATQPGYAQPAAGSAGYAQQGHGTGPAADRPPQEAYADEDVWEGGLVNYYDSYGVMHTAPRAKRPFGERVIGAREFGRPMIWRAALHEFVGTMLYVVWSCAGVYLIARSGYTNISHFWYAFINFFIYAILIFATTAASGGHLNPVITLATCFAGFTKVSRALLYMIFQFAGGLLGAALVWGWLSDADQFSFGAGNCSKGPFRSRSEALLLETFANYLFLFVVFGVALDPAQRRIFGPVLGPIFLSLALSCVMFFTGISGQYQGAWVNPPRCFGAAVISGDWHDEVWISIIAWLISSLLMGITYLLVPFNHELRSRHHLAKEHQLQYAQQQPVAYATRGNHL